MGDGLRDTMAGSLGAGNDGQSVRLAGWVASRRDHGGVIFLDLRDASGVVQVVVDPVAQPQAAAVAHDVRLEYCLSVSGAVRLRPDGTINPDMETGEVEVAADGVTVLSSADPLPFQIDDRLDVDEAKRLEFRYLDLRRPRMAANLRARSSAIGAIRRSMDEQGFLEVETPTLIRSTPEGARDLLVPSRLRKGSFYALPQSPQLFKQLLMVAGVDRYYQIARCYRDEDTRADRQIEFTQLDVEGAFWGQDDVHHAIETAVAKAVEAVRGVAPALPLPKMTYAEAMARFGTDKPDLRFGMELVDLSVVFGATEFNAFSGVLADGGVIKGINAGNQGELSRSALDQVVAQAQELGAKGLVWMVVEDDGTLRSPVAKFLSDTELSDITGSLSASTGELLLIVADAPAVVANVLGELRLQYGQPDGHDELNFLWIIDFPVFETTADGSLVPAHHPFTAPVDV
ncbi:MAG: aspartate--tRNA ligase, partial [Acidimicrobiia bacterium]|nr:aspartate--tRNA ligase [Acidimicrobiia bacterium]